MMRSKRIALIIAATCVSASLLLSGCNKNNIEASKEFYAMDTQMSIKCTGENSKKAIDKCVDRIYSLESILSVTIDESEVSKINSGKNVKLSSDVKDLLNTSIDISDKTGGAFDIALYPLIECWGFRSGELNIPDNDELEKYLSTCTMSEFEYSKGDDTIQLCNNQGIDFGGIAKGYASDEVVKILKNNGIKSAYMSLGGNVYCLGLKKDNSKWRVGIVNPTAPNDTNSLLGIVSVRDRAVVTSGGYERYLEDEKTGKKYHHILDPSTGYPADNDLISVTIVSENGIMADCLSTACYVMGLEKSIEYWNKYGQIDKFDIILMTKDENVFITKGLDGAFESKINYSIVGD